MRKAAVLLALTLVVASCSSSDGEAASSTADDATSPGSAESAASPDDDAELDSESAAAEAFDYSTIDYDLEPEGSALRADRRADVFPPPVVDPADIVSGGPPPDGIPPIDDPVYAPISDIDFIDDENEGVVVVEINGEVKAYPIQILIWHEIVNDEVGGVPVTVTYCPLCNSALVFERQFGDRLLDFGTSGELYQSALVMYDRQTESLWAHFTGQGLVGHYAGAQLELVAAQTLGWGSFTEAFPDAEVLTLDTGFSRRYGENPYEGYDDSSTNPIGGFISQPIDDQFSAKDRVVGIIDDSGTYAVLLEDLEGDGAVEFAAAERTIVVFQRGGLNSSLEDRDIAGGRDVGQTGAFVAVADDGTELTFTRSGDNFVDDQTGSTWDILGRATAGPLAGEHLEGVPALDTFWFSWSTYQPDHVLVSP